MRRRLRKSAVPYGIRLSSVAVVAFQLGCNSGSEPAKTAANETGRRPTEVVHEECDIKDSNAERLDADGDGRADVTIVRSGNREVCRAVDLNFDGKIDTWVYKDASGQVRRRESDYDRDGRIDEIALYQAGVILEKHRSTTLSNKLDTWEFYQGGRLARTERDSNGDENIDQWWEYPKPGCPLIHSDVNNDGRPDPGATIDYCKETGYVPPERMGRARPKSPSFDRPGTLPTELETKEMDSPQNPDQAPSDSGGQSSGDSGADSSAEKP